MASDDFLSLEWEGLAELERQLGEISDNLEDIIKQEYTKYGLLVEEGAKALTFQDEGDLAASINFTSAKKQGGSIVVEGGTNMEYALRLHEKPYGNKTHHKYENHSKFRDYYIKGRGERTRAKSNWRGMEPGRKFLLNAINATKPDYDRMNKRIMDRALRGDRT